MQKLENVGARKMCMAGNVAIVKWDTWDWPPLWDCILQMLSIHLAAPPVFVTATRILATLRKTMSRYLSLKMSTAGDTIKKSWC